MCLQNCLLVPLQNKPIKCYKILIQNGAWYHVKKFTAPFQIDFRYIIGETYNENNQSYYKQFLEVIHDCYFHSFKYLEDCYKFIETYPKSDFRKHQKLVIVECEIPINSACYEGEFSYWAMKSYCCSYASKSITLKRIIK